MATTTTHHPMVLDLTARRRQDPPGLDEMLADLLEPELEETLVDDADVIHGKVMCEDRTGAVALRAGRLDKVCHRCHSRRLGPTAPMAAATMLWRQLHRSTLQPFQLIGAAVSLREESPDVVARLYPSVVDAIRTHVAGQVTGPPDVLDVSAAISTCDTDALLDAAEPAMAAHAKDRKSARSAREVAAQTLDITREWELANVHGIRSTLPPTFHRDSAARAVFDAWLNLADAAGLVGRPPIVISVSPAVRQMSHGRDWLVAGLTIDRHLTRGLSVVPASLYRLLPGLTVSTVAKPEWLEAGRLPAELPDVLVRVEDGEPSVFPQLMDDRIDAALALLRK